MLPFFDIRTIMHNDEFFMGEALRVAEYGRGRTSPNPLVGAVIVKDGKIVAQGWHRKAGTPHAEIHALNMAGDLAKGATIYVTLEPCAHYGRTAPCAEALVRAEIKRAVIALKDPNPLVAGKGINILQEAGIEVFCGIMEKEARRQNEIFLKWITKKMPFVTLKTAMSLDGKIATFTGASQWITNETSRELVHRWRDAYDGILVGINTVLADNPSLTARLPKERGKNPTRIIVDSNARLPLTAKVLTEIEETGTPTLVAVTENADKDKTAALQELGATVLVAGDGERVNLSLLMKMLAEREICSVFVEGGGTINFSLLKENLVDKIYAFVAPKIIGGKNAPTPVAGEGFAKIDDCIAIKDMTLEDIAGDLLITGYLRQEN